LTNETEERIIMEIKAYKITFSQLIAIFTEDYEKMSLSLLDGLKKMGKPNITRYELDSIRLGIMDLYKNKAFNEKSGKIDLYLNLNFGYGELDLSFFVTYKNKLTWVDFEEKTLSQGGDKEETRKKLEEQIEKHSNEILENYKNDCSYLIIGYIDNTFVKCLLKESEKSKANLKYEELLSVLQNSIPVENSETIISDLQHLGNVRNTIKEISTKKFKFFKTTTSYTKSIEALYENGGKAAVCYGGAGSGKTIIAFNLLLNSKYSDKVKLLLMNKKFYYSLGLDLYYFQKKCFYGSNAFLDEIDADTIAVIDEAQRLPFDTLIEIVMKAKFTVILGDSNQSFYFSDNIMSMDELVDAIQSKGIDCKGKTIAKFCRYNQETHELIQQLTSIDGRKKLLNNFNEENCNYSFEIYNNLSVFLNDYLREDSKKLFIPTKDRYSFSPFLFENKKFELLENGEDIFSYPDREEVSYIGDTFHAISFDVENCYVLLNNTGLSSIGKNQILTNKLSQNHTPEYDRQYLNELNVLFTRGTKSLHIYAKDVYAYLFLRMRLACLGWDFKK
jgi:hypothetical protein